MSQEDGTGREELPAPKDLRETRHRGVETQDDRRTKHFDYQLHVLPDQMSFVTYLKSLAQPITTRLQQTAKDKHELGEDEEEFKRIRKPFRKAVQVSKGWRATWQDQSSQNIAGIPLTILELQRLRYDQGFGNVPLKTYEYFQYYKERHHGYWRKRVMMKLVFERTEMTTANFIWFRSLQNDPHEEAFYPELLPESRLGKDRMRIFELSFQLTLPPTLTFCRYLSSSDFTTDTRDLGELIFDPKNFYSSSNFALDYQSKDQTYQLKKQTGIGHSLLEVKRADAARMLNSVFDFVPLSKQST